MNAIAERQTADWLDRKSYDFTPHHLLVEGGRMHFIDEGQGSPILFVHGNATWSFFYRAAIRDMVKAGFRCIAPDNIGFGLSEKPKNFSYNPAALSRNLGRLIEHLDLTDITLVVHDYGGPIGLGYAIDHPERFKRVVLLNTWINDISAEPGVAKMAQAAKGGIGQLLAMGASCGPSAIRTLFANKERWTDQLESSYCHPLSGKDEMVGPKALARHLVESSESFNEVWRQRETLRGMPMLIVWGLKDPLLGEKMLNKIWHEFPCAEVQTLKEAGRFAMEESSREVINHLRQFATSAPSPLGFAA